MTQDKRKTIVRAGYDALGPRYVPERRYEIAAEILAATIEQLGEQLPPDALRDSARRVGQAIGSAARKHVGRRRGRKRLREALVETLRERGYEPREATSGEIRLGNCPFHALADDHRRLICGMNLALADGLLDGLGDGALARLDPQPSQFCVTIGPQGPAGVKAVKGSGDQGCASIVDACARMTIWASPASTSRTRT